MVMVRSPNQIFITGHAVGDTNIFFLDAQGKLLRRAEIHVGPDAEGAHAAIVALMPDDDIRVSSVGGLLVPDRQARATRTWSIRRERSPGGSSPPTPMW